jgi:hypothetical protein
MERSMERDKVGFRFQAEVIQKLCHWGSRWLKIPSLVEDGMVAKPRACTEVDEKDIN